MATVNRQREIEDFEEFGDHKDRGAFYTDARVADFLVRWAIRTSRDSVMDPSFGEGVFLRSACRRLAQLGGDPSSQVFGVEIDPNTYIYTVRKLSAEFGVRKKNLLLSNFFDLDCIANNQVNVMVGNPPFIRYQRFRGNVRKQALKRAANQGVALSALSSSWAPFLIHAIAMLRPRGRLAMVVPIEIGHAAYALPVLKFLARSFGKVTFLTFQEKLFPQLSENTLLLLAENKGPGSAQFFWRDLSDAGCLSEISARNKTRLMGTELLNGSNISEGKERLVEYFVPAKTRELYRELKRLSVTQRLGELAKVGIGYVTGANDFFHLDRRTVRLWRIPKAFLKPTVRRGRAFSGLSFTEEDWRRAMEIGESGYLLYVRNENLPRSVSKYLDYGERQGVHMAYKCRVRSPWFSVPHVYQPDSFLSYMSGTTPFLVANGAHAVAPNSLHIVRLHPGAGLGSEALAALWQTSLSRLSAEIEGHPLGGGMLKLEPSEAENVVIASPDSDNGSLLELSEKLDRLIREGKKLAAQAYADAVILRNGIGLSKSDCDLLQMAAATLKKRRYCRGSSL